MDNNKRKKVEQVAVRYMNRELYSKAVKEYKNLLKYFPDEITYLKQIARCYEELNQVDDVLLYYDMLASVYKSKSFYKQAIAIYSIMMSYDDAKEDVYDNMALCYKELNRTIDAGITYRRLLEIYMKKGLFSSAVSVASKILDFHPEDTIAIVNAAEAQLQLKNKDKSIELFRMAAQIYKKQNNLAMYTKILGRINHVSGSTDAKTLNELAAIYIVQKNYDEQLLELLLKSYRISKEAKDDNMLIETTKLLVTFFKETNQQKQMLSIRFELAKLYEKIGEKKKALDTYNKILNISPKNKDVNLRVKELKQELEKEKSYKSPVTSNVIDVKKIPVLEPPVLPKQKSKDTLAKEDLKNILKEVDTYIKFKLYAKAIPILKDLYEKNPYIISISKRLKDVYIKTHQVDKVKELLFKLFEDFRPKDSVKAKEFLEEILYIDSSDEKANRYLSKYYDVGVISDSISKEDVLTGIEVDSNEFLEDDEKLLDSISSLNQDYLGIIEEEEDPQLEQIKFYITQGMFDLAKDELDKRLKDFPNDSETLTLLSELEQQIKSNSLEIEENIDDTFKKFQKGVDDSISKSDAKTRYDLGIAYKGMGFLDEAIKEFKSIFKYIEKKEDCLLMIGLCYNDKGEYDTSIRYFKKSLEYAKSNSQKLAIYYEIANAYDLSGNLKHAFNIFKKIVKIQKTFRDSHSRLKKIYTKLKTDRENDLKLF